MRRRTLLKGVAATAATGLLVRRAAADTPLKMGISIPLTGAGFAAVGRQATTAIKLYMQQHGDTVAGRKIQITIRDDGGVADVAHRIIQDMIVNDKVDIVGIGITPTSLAVAPLVTQAKKATLVISSGASMTTTKSPYFVRAGFILSPQSWILAEWAAKNGSKRVVTLVNEWAPGIEAETAFTTRFKQVGGEIMQSIRIPLANPDFAPFLQRVGDLTPDTAFISFPDYPGRRFSPSNSSSAGWQGGHQDHRSRRPHRRRRSQRHGRSDARHHHGRTLFRLARFRPQQGLRRRYSSRPVISGRISFRSAAMTACT